MHAERIRVEVVYCPAPGQVDQLELQLALPCTVADALRASGVIERHGLDPTLLQAGVWCKVRPLHHPLREGDRIEVYRVLIVDPKEARRQRYKQHLAAQDAKS